MSCTYQYHNNQKFDLYCQQCTIPVCVDCSVYPNDHPDHHVSEQIIQSKEEIQQKLIDFQLAQQNLKDIMTVGKDMREMIKARKNEVGSTIRQVFFKLKQLLCHHEQELLGKISEEATMGKDIRLSIQLEGIQYLLVIVTLLLLVSTVMLNYSLLLIPDIKELMTFKSYTQRYLLISVSHLTYQLR